MIKRILGIAALLTLVLGSVAPTTHAQRAVEMEYEGAAALGLALRQLGTSQRVLMVAAHPDDESTQILATFALGHGAEVAYLSLTRGEGGQNGIGPELQEPLGLIRSEELLAARRLDGARQYFTRAYDYGFSKNADEAFRHWPRDELLADVVAVVREFRPDVMISVFSGTPSDGHGQHQAAGIMAREAFAAAGDPARFPDQLASGLTPHQPKQLYQALWRPDGNEELSLETGIFDPLLGRSYYQIAMASRSRHRSQDMGRLETPGPQESSLRLIESHVPLARTAGAGSSPLAVDAASIDGTAFTLSARAGDEAPAAVGLLRDYERVVAEVRNSADLLDPAAIVPLLADAMRLLDESAAATPAESPMRERIETERLELNQALTLAAGIVFDAVASHEEIVPGQDFDLELVLWNGGDVPIAVDALEPRVPDGWRAVSTNRAVPSVQPGELVRRTFTVSVPADAPATEPYYLAQARAGDMYTWPAGDVITPGAPFQPDPVSASAIVRVGGEAVELEQDATYALLDRRIGEIRRPVRVVPAVTLDVSPEIVVQPAAQQEPLEIVVTLRNHAPAPANGLLRLDVPAEWDVEPTQISIDAQRAGAFSTHRFRVQPSAAGNGYSQLRAVFVDASAAGASESYSRGFELVDYPHIRPRPIYRDAITDVRIVDVDVPSGLRIGYIAGAGDSGPQAIRQLGLDLEMIEPQMLQSGDLDRYDVIVTGIRAYEVRPDLVDANERLLDFARRGGTLIVQYNKYEFNEPRLAPYPIEIARPHDRVTDENAAVTILQPDHPVFNTPNRITQSDFDGWVQERGLYFLHEWDEPFEPLLEMADPGEEPLRGSLLVAPLGEGTYVYTGLAFFRQFSAGVPVAYRLFANLLALGGR